jgi:hypothetical protein
MIVDESPDIKLARVDVQLVGIKESLVKIEAKIDVWGNLYVPRAEINEMFRARDKEIQELKDLKRDSKALIVSWAGVAVAVIAVCFTLWSNR